MNRATAPHPERCRICMERGISFARFVGESGRRAHDGAKDHAFESADPDHDPRAVAGEARQVIALLRSCVDAGGSLTLADRARILHAYDALLAIEEGRL